VAVVMTVAVFMFLFNFHRILLLNLLISYALDKDLLFSLTGSSELDQVSDAPLESGKG